MTRDECIAITEVSRDPIQRCSDGFASQGY
jgi:hypothetical protein